MEELKNIIDQIDELKSKLDSLRPFNVVLQQKVEQTFRLWWNYHSNAIEGNKLTLGETKSLILHGLTAKGKPIKDHTDIEGHNSVLIVLQDLISEERDISEHLIRELHEALLVKPYPMPSKTPNGEIVERMIKIGQYKTTPNNVETSTGETHFYTMPELVQAEMMSLIAWYKKALDLKMHPVLIAAEFHYRFVSIHPFDDGNGRMARILMNMILMKNGYIPAILKIDDRSEYIMALEHADKNSREEFYEYVARCELESISKYLKGIQGEEITEDDDLDKKITMLDRKIRGLENSTGVDYGISIDEWVREIATNVIGYAVSKFAKFFDRISIKMVREGDDGIQEEYETYDVTDFIEGSADWIGQGIEDFKIRFYLIGFRAKSVESFDEGFDIEIDFAREKPVIIYSDGSEYIYTKSHSETHEVIEKIRKHELEKMIERIDRKTSKK